MYKHRKTFNFDRLSGSDKKLLQPVLEKLDNSVDILRTDDHRVEVTREDLTAYNVLVRPGLADVTSSNSQHVQPQLVEHGLLLGGVEKDTGTTAWGIVWLPSDEYLAGRITIHDALVAEQAREAFSMAIGVLMARQEARQEIYLTSETPEGARVSEAPLN